MEIRSKPKRLGTPFRVHISDAPPRGIYRRDSFVDSILTDAALTELKDQSVNSCLLCSLEEWEDQDWD